MIVVDSSLIVAALTSDDLHGKRSRAALADDHNWQAPDHLRVESTSAIKGRLLGGKISLERAQAAVETLNRLRIACAPWGEVADRVWELRSNLTPYDAAFIALAELRGCRVVTADRKLANCSVRRCPVEVITP